MATNRQYEAANVFNARVVDMRHLWTPSMEYMGKPSQKPNYFASFIVPKTQGHWSQEPIFANVMAGFGKLLQGQLQAFAQNPNGVMWPIVDGDMPNPTTGKTSEFAKGQWLFSGSTNSPPNVELVQAGGALVKLPNKVNVKSGDHAMVGVTAAVKTNQPNGVKFYLNAVVFTGPGEEIVFANSVSGAELMRMAEQQGLRPAGFSPSPGGFGGGAPAAGFTPGPSAFAPAPNPTTFAPPPNNTPGAFAPPPAAGATAFPSNPMQQAAPNFAPAAGAPVWPAR